MNISGTTRNPISYIKHVLLMRGSCLSNSARKNINSMNEYF